MSPLSLVRSRVSLRWVLTSAVAGVLFATAPASFAQDYAQDYSGGGTQAYSPYQPNTPQPNTYQQRSPYSPPPAAPTAPPSQQAAANPYNYAEPVVPLPQNGAPANDAYSPPGAAGGQYGYAPPQGDAYVPPRADTYSPPPRYANAPPNGYTDPGEPAGGPVGSQYGQPYAPPPPQDGQGGYANDQQASRSTYDQTEIISAGHNFFGAVNKNLASAIEYAFQSKGRPNGYILGEDAGGAFVLGLRYGEGKLYTKDAGDHKVYWQGPSVGYDAGAEGSKTMVLVYNLRDPSEIYERFGGVQGSAYFVGGFSVQFQQCNDVMLGIIRSGVGVRLGANIGYLKYTRTPTWNPL